MKCVALVLCVLAAEANLFGLPDKTCRNGVANGALTACCSKDCGACDDLSAECTGGGDKSKVKGGCCPSQILKGPRECDMTQAPCKLSEDFRKPQFDLKDIKDVRHAQDDCLKAKEDHIREMRMNVNFVKKAKTDYPSNDIGACEPSDDISKKCLADAKCLGFSLQSGCMKFELVGEAPADSDFYVKVKNEAGKPFAAGIKTMATKK